MYFGCLVAGFRNHCGGSWGSREEAGKKLGRARGSGMANSWILSGIGGIGDELGKWFYGEWRAGGFTEWRVGIPEWSMEMH